MNVIKRAPAVYDPDWPAVRYIGYNGSTDYGVARNDVLEGLPEQHRKYGANPVAISCEWIVPLSLLGQWVDWMEDNGIGNYFSIDLPTNKNDLGDGSRPVDTELVTVVSPLGMTPLGADKMIVRANLAFFPRDIGKGHLGVGGEIGDAHTIGEWIIAGTPPNPSVPDWFIAGTPPAPNNTNNVAAGRPGNHP